MKPSLTHYRKIFSDVEKKTIAGLYLLEGPEAFIMEEMANRIAGSIVPTDLRAFNLMTAYGSEVDVDEFVSAASSFPFLSDHRVLVLRELEKLRGSWKRLVAYCENPSPSSVVIFLYHPFDELKNRLRSPRDFDKLKKAVQARGKVIAFEPLSPDELTTWIVQKAKRSGVTMDAEVAEALARSVGDNLFDLANEIEKLAVLGADGPLGLGDLAAVVGSYRLQAIWDLIDSVVPGREARAFSILSRIIRTGAERPPSIVYHLIRHFLSLLKNKAGYGEEGMWAYRARRQAASFGTGDLIVWLENLRRTELLMKTSSFPEEALLTAAFAHSMRGRLLENPAA
jgi:DNA polymerase III subunit delta